MKKFLAAVLSVLLLCAPMSAGAYAAEEEMPDTKSETVYVLCGADGEVQKVLSSCHIENEEEKDELSDVSDLEDITVVKGDADFTAGEDGALTWKAAGKDVYYQGTSAKTPPVSVKLTYTLDGEEIPAGDVDGVTGRLTLRVEYENALQADGADATVPMLFLTGLVLDNSQAENIEVTNARAADDGTHTVVLGAALPGIRDCFDLEDREDLPELPDHIEISADVTDFKAPMTLTVVTSEPFSAADVSGFDKADDLRSSVTDLTDAMAQLIDGSGQLYDGLATLSDKAAELTEGVGKLSDGSQALADGLDTLAENSDDLTGGAAQIFDALLAQANGALAAAGLTLPELTADNYAEELDSLLDGSFVEASAEEQVEQAVRASEADVRAAVTQAVQEQVEAQVLEAVTEEVRTQVLAALNMTPEDWQAGIDAGLVTEDQQAQAEAAVQQQLASDEVQAMIENQTAEQMASDQVASLIDRQTEAQIDELIGENMASDQVIAQEEAASEQLSAAAETIGTLKAQLDQVHEFVTGLAAYTDGVASAQAGARELNEGVGLLLNGAPGSDGQPAREGVTALPEGVDALRDGALELQEGIQKLDEEGIQKLADAVNGDLAELADTVRGLLDASRGYTTFSGLAEDMTGTVRFIIRTDPDA